MTFSLIGQNKDRTEIGVAVASKFLAVGAYVPSASADAGALATQAFGNMAIRKQGLELLRKGLSPADMLQTFLANDALREKRQIGVVDRQGVATTFTGKECGPWAGGASATHPDGSYAAQGNMLAGPEVVKAMEASWLALAKEPSLARRLVKGLEAGQAAGGDPRGKQSAAVLVMSEGKGYGGLTDVMLDLRSDDSIEPISELLRLIELHELYFGKSPAESLLGFNEKLLDEVSGLLKRVGFADGDVVQNLNNWMNRENFEERWYDDKLDPVVFEQLKLMSKK